MRSSTVCRGAAGSGTAYRSRFSPAFLAGLLLASLAVGVATDARQAEGSTLQPGFQESIVFSGLINPSAIRFASDGRVFVAEKRGVIKVFDNLSDTTPTTLADLRTNVYNFWDRGLLGLALHPSFPSTPYVYVLYTYDAAIGGTAPRWGTPGTDSDPCPNPPGATSDGCVVSGRLSRLQVGAGNTLVGSEQVLINDWCQQYPSHSIGALEFGADGSLYVSGGDGASFTFVDYGQDGSPVNPCGDPFREGGALRSQDLRTSGDPVTLDGAVLRVDPNTGAGVAGNPFAGSTSANARRIVAYGLRNPFRMVRRPDTNEVWVGDVGWNDWEELDLIPNANDAVAENFGWPCYEGDGRQSGYDAANLSVCENLYSQAGAVTAPYFPYRHSDQVVPGELCPTGSSSISGLSFEFYAGGSYPPEYDGALFFADYSRDCIWVMPKGATGRPNPAARRTFVQAAANPVDVQVGPGGDLFYVDFDGGTIRRISYAGAGPTCPKGQFRAEYFNNMGLSGAPAATQCEPAPVDHDWGTGAPAAGVNADNFSARWSGTFDFAGGNTTFTIRTDDGMRLYLDGALLLDGWRDQAPTQYQATRSVTAGEHTVVVDYYEHTGGAVAYAGWQAATGNLPPTPTIAQPAAGTTWQVGSAIAFSGSATDPEDGALPASALSWTLTLYHCPSNCHTHLLQTFPGRASGSFAAPDHDYPSYLELALTATDSGGLSTTVTRRLDPRTVVLSFRTSPTGLQLTFNGTSAAAPFSRTVIVGSANTVSAPSPQGGRSFLFWSDGGARTHTITAPSSARTYTAYFL